jgi:hypothetical protein
MEETDRDRDRDRCALESENGFLRWREYLQNVVLEIDMVILFQS